MKSAPAWLAGLLRLAAALGAGAESGGLLRGLSPAAAPGAAPGAAPAAPAPSAFAVPDVAQTVGQRMMQDSARLGGVAQNLMSMQADINRVEKEVLGKVFDMQSMKNFFSTHQAVLDDNKRLTSEVTKLSTDLGQVSNGLASMRAKSENLENEHRQHIAELQAKVSEDEAVIQDLDAEMKHEKMLEQDNSKLKQINNALREESSKATSQASQAHYELTETKSTLQEHMKVTGLLQGQLVKQHEYGITCHDRVATLETQLRATAQSQAVERVATNNMIKQATSSTSAIQQTLMAENAQLKNMLQSAKEMAIIYQNQLIKGHADMTSLQDKKNEELRSARADLERMRQHIKMVEDSLSTNINGRVIAEKKLDQKKRTIMSLQANDQLRKDAKRMQKALEISQVTEAQAKAQVMRAQRLMAVWRKSAKQNAAAAEAAAREAFEKLGAAKTTKEEALVKTQAETAVLTQCGAVWDKKHKELLDKLSQCGMANDDLKTVHALTPPLGDSPSSEKAGD